MAEKYNSWLFYGSTLYVGLVWNGRGFSRYKLDSLYLLLQAQLNFLHLENNAEDDDMSAQTPPEQRQQSTPAAL